MLKGSTCLVILISLLTSIGSIGTYLRLDDQAWTRIGVDKREIQSVLEQFPRRHCSRETEAICRTVAAKVRWFIGA